MAVLLSIIALVLLAFFAIQGLSLYWISKLDQEKERSVATYPMVSLLLAARNEEALIRRSLAHIAALNYPKDRLQVLIGDDDSSDGTVAIVAEFLEQYPHFELVKIRGTLGLARGKANVLAHLAHYADGEFYLITDVDVALPPEWVHGMLAQFKKDVGIVSGTTLCASGGPFATMQRIDWLHFMGYIKAFATVGVSCTSVGNNMAVRAEAYWQTGGYEKIPFSITEDYKLFKEVTARGWGWSNGLGPDTLGQAWYIPSIKEMLHQRKRWLMGARELPLNWKVMIVLYGSFIPALLLLACWYPRWALILWGVKFAIQSSFIQTLCRKAGEPRFGLWQLLVYEGYVLLNTVATALFYFLPIPSVWKGRVYHKSYIRD